MKISDITKKTRHVKQYLVKIKIVGSGYTNIVDTIVYAANPQWARKIAKAQYNGKNVIVGQPKEIKRR